MPKDHLALPVHMVPRKVLLFSVPGPVYEKVTHTQNTHDGPRTVYVSRPHSGTPDPHICPDGTLWGPDKAGDDRWAVGGSRFNNLV